MTETLLPDSGTAPQQRGYQKLLESPLKNQALNAIHALIRVDELPIEELGNTWGVTGFPADSDTVVLRLNAGINYIAEVKAPNGIQRLAELRLYTASKVTAPFPGSLSGPVEMKNAAYVVTAPLDRALDLIDDPSIADAHRGLVNASRRKLLNQGWHNPLLNPLVTPTAS